MYLLHQRWAEESESKPCICDRTDYPITKTLCALQGDKYIIEPSGTLINIFIDKFGIDYKVFIASAGNIIELASGNTGNSDKYSNNKKVFLSDATAYTIKDSDNIHGNDYIPFDLLSNTTCWVELSAPADVYQLTVNVESDKFNKALLHNIRIKCKLYNVINGTLKGSNDVLLNNVEYINVSNTKEYISLIEDGSISKELASQYNDNNKSLITLMKCDMDYTFFEDKCEKMKGSENLTVMRSGDVLVGLRFSKPNVHYEVICSGQYSPCVYSGTSTDEPTLFGSMYAKLENGERIIGANYIPLISLAYVTIEIKTSEPVEVYGLYSHFSHNLRRTFAQLPHTLELMGKKYNIASGMIGLVNN